MSNQDSKRSERRVTMQDARERDLVLAPNEYAYILDETKGNVIVYVGPHKTSMANTDRPVVFDAPNRRFLRCNLEESIKMFPFAEEGNYIMLENPAKEGDESPRSGPNSLPKLLFGRKISIPGPATFPLWPGQLARVVSGHHLRSNQYLLVRVYNEEAARENWAKAVIKPQKLEPGESTIPPVETEDGGVKTVAVRPDQEVPDLTTGQILVVKGTEVSFYIPPTGIEVVLDGDGNFIREAVTLERLDYCILLDENGNKRYIRGPAVVFPKPTETFIEKNGSRRFRAIELNEISGLYVKVIAPYKDENGFDCKAGDELFITGHDQMIYFPRPEHAIIKYDNQDVHYAVAIPAGEARYVLERLTGKISLKRGPCMFLADPRKEVIVRRVLDLKAVNLLYPGNAEALEYNRNLLALSRQRSTEYVTDREAALAFRESQAPRTPKPGVKVDMQKAEVVSDDFTRRTAHTPPRTITLDTKYEGAVTVEVWTGYAVLIVSKSGSRRVVVGPQTVLLEYDETLEPFELSTGTPKTEQNLIRSAFLRVLNNKVSDVVSAETRDLCPVTLLLSYRVDFEADPIQWFNVENYVKFLTDHLRSLVRNSVKRYGIEDFYANAITYVRDTILGKSDENGNRPGQAFKENGMRIYDVEVLDVRIGDEAIAELLIQAQHKTVQQTIRMAQEEKLLEITRKTEDIKQQIATSQAETTQRLLSIQIDEINTKANLQVAEISASIDAETRRLDAKRAQQELIDQIARAELVRERARLDQESEIAGVRLRHRLEELKAEVDAVVMKAQAVSPDLVAALQAFGDKNLAEKMAQSMAPLAIMGGTSIAEVFSKLLKGTPLEAILSRQIEEKSKM